MKKVIVALGISILILGFSSTGFCADVLKIGVVNFEKILKESSAGKMTQIQLKAKRDEFQKKLEDEKNKLEEMKKTFEREALVLSPEKQQEKQREFRIKVNDLKLMQQDIGRQFKQFEVSLLNKIQKEVFEIADKIGNQKKYSLIIEQKTAGVIFREETLDITDQIIKQYNQNIAKTN